MVVTKLLTKCVLLCVLVGATEIVFTRNSFRDRFTNMAFNREIIYVGAKNYIFVLNGTDLSKVHEVRTCTGECDNINKVLVVNKKLNQLIICGTGNYGSCTIRSLNTTVDILATSETGDGEFTDYLVVSTDLRRPSSFVLTEKTGGLYAGVTYGPGVYSLVDQHGSFFNYLGYYGLLQNTFLREKKIKVQLKSIPLEDYLVYFKAGFELDRFVYFVTNQKFKAGDVNYTSKLIRICQDDSEFYSYTDIKLECVKDGTVYNLIQDISLLEPGEDLRKHLNATGKIMAAAFASGFDPESPVAPSAICLYKLEDINHSIMQAKRNFITCSVQGPPEEGRYLSYNIQRCADSSEYEEDHFTCNRKFQQFTYITGDESSSLSASAIFTSSSSGISGYFSKIQTTTSGNNTIFHTGTSNGWLIKLNANTAQADVFDKKDIDEGHPITELHIESGGKIQYVMSERKIVKYEITACNYPTCAATMKIRNPLCGWCVYENKSTFKENSTCPYLSYHGHWLSSLTECLTLDVHPKGVPVRTKVNVTVGINLPQNLIGDTYECNFASGSDNSNRVAALVSGGNAFRCNSGSSAAHSDGKLEFYVKHNDKKTLLAKTDFLFFDCEHYNKCGDCTGDKRANCSWDSLNTRCISKNISFPFIQQKTNCPKFQRDTNKHYIPSGIARKLTFNVSNLVNSSDTRYFCRLNGSVVEAVKENDNIISCKLQVSAGSNKESEYVIQINYGITRNSTFEGENKVVVYNCKKLGTDCSICRSLKYINSAFECDWCSGSCIWPAVTASCDEKCNPPYIIKVVPNTAGTNGNITVTVNGQELGSKSDEVNNISLAGFPCTPQKQNYKASKSITCKAETTNSPQTGPVVVFVNNQRSTGNVSFSYKLPKVTEVIPDQGPQAGGTRITVKGKDLGTGTRVVSVYVTNTTKERKECMDAGVKPDSAIEAISSSEFWIECDTPRAVVEELLMSLEIIFEGGTEIQTNMTFTYLENPEIEGLRPDKGIASGGNHLTVTGKKFKNAYKGYVSGESETLPCQVTSETEMICPVPKLTLGQREELNKRLNVTRKRRQTDSDAIPLETIIHLDGVHKSFNISFYRDPSFSDFEEDDKVKSFGSDQKMLTIQGNDLNLVATRDEVNVTVGVGICKVIELKENSLTCVPPTSQPASSVAGAILPEVNVSIGNVRATVGYLRYAELPKELPKLRIIIGVISGFLAVAGIVAGTLLLKNRRKSEKMRNLKRHMEDQEMEIRDIFREEFADMHTSMFVVNNSLIEQGCPYHHYQKYTFNVMFRADNIDSHPLLQEPLVTETVRSKLERGMEEFESLIFNKYFLLSVINSMENQKKFDLKDKANLCGYICTILLGRMEYLQEILVDLVGNLVQESAGKKKQKVLFRRCETITEKLLSNWLSLCLYPHLKSQSGRPLYLLYKATQLHMEAGPIDAITNDAKYTLSEEKLLKNYSQHSKQGSDEPTFEAKCLTLNVVVDNCRDIKICRVLDCDTITQVKEKCLTQIYVNHPASNLSVTPEKLELEWHAGVSGSLRLRDVDNTSKRHRIWVRLNTLAHYNVKDESNMALIDPQVNTNYANLARVSLSCPIESSMDSSDAATAPLLMEQGDREWHIVKPEEGTLAAGKSQIPTELYLNRLLTFKQSILEYVRAIYDTVLNADILPPHVHYLYHLLDDLADKNKVEADILHSWKSMSYPVRIWATLMNDPSIVFDIKSPPYVDTSMEVISQVFIECFSLETHKLSKNSPTHKLIFSNEMNQYKEKVKQFYKNISEMESQQDGHRKYLEEVNKLQQQHTSFNKMSALHKLFEQIQPYIEEVINDLSNNRDACKLQLDKKLEQISGLMEED